MVGVPTVKFFLDLEMLPTIKFFGKIEITIKLNENLYRYWYGELYSP